MQKNKDALSNRQTSTVNYERLLIKDYNYWKVYLFENQCYLGRTYIWAKRENALDFFDMTKDEQEEYFRVGMELKKALQKLFNPDLYNYATLANVTPHLHTHIIPRYTSIRQFGGIEFEDKRWGQNYAPYDENFKLTEAQLANIRNAIARELR